MSSTQNFSMVRGDTLSFDVIFSDIEDSSITSLYFSVKKKATDVEYAFQKSLNDGIEHISDHTYRVRIAPEDTDGVSAGSYVYDLQVGVSLDIFTLLMGQFKIIQDVTSEK